MLRMVSYFRRSQSGQIMCYLNRTYHVLLTRVSPALDIALPKCHFYLLFVLRTRYSEKLSCGGVEWSAAPPEQLQLQSSSTAAERICEDTGLLSRQVFRRGLLGRAVHAFLPRAHPRACRVRIHGPGASRRSAVQRRGLHRRRERHRRFQILVFAAHNLVVRPSSERVSYR